MRRLSVRARQVMRGPLPPSRDISSLRAGTRFAAAGPRVRFQPGIYRAIDFRDYDFDYFLAFAGARFVQCDFSGARFADGSVLSAGGPVEYIDCHFDRSTVGDCQTGRARFLRCTFESARLGFISDCASFVECTFSGRLHDTTFNGRPWGPCADVMPREERLEFRGNDFTRAELYLVVFRYGVDLSAQRLPEGSEYVRVTTFPRQLHLAKGEVARWDDDTKEPALAFLEWLEDTYLDQPDVYARRVEPGIQFKAEIQAKIWGLLARESGT
jgi:hypothetical protein